MTPRPLHHRVLAMSSRQPSRLILFVIDLIRFALLFMLFPSVSATSNFSAYLFIGFAAPQALFILLSFFMWWSPQKYRGFSALYAAGKAISASALASRLFIGLNSAREIFAINDINTFLLVVVSGAIALCDLLCVLFLLATFLVHRTAPQVNQINTQRNISEKPLDTETTLLSSDHAIIENITDGLGG